MLAGMSGEVRSHLTAFQAPAGACPAAGQVQSHLHRRVALPRRAHAWSATPSSCGAERAALPETLRACPQSSIAVIGVTGVVCSCLCGRWRFDAPREVRLALFQEGRQRLFCVSRADLYTELFVLSLHRRLDLLAKWLLQEPLVGYDLGNQTQLRGAPGIEGNSQQNQFRRTDVTGPRRHGVTRSEFRHDSKIDEWHLEMRALARVDEVTVRQHGGATADRGAVDRGDQRLVEVDQRLHQSGLRKIPRPRRILEKILEIVTRAERMSRAMPEDDTRVVVIRCLVQDACESHVHG